MAKSLEIFKMTSIALLRKLAMIRICSQGCSLVSSSFLLPSRKQLFSRIIFRLGNYRTWQGIHQLLVQNVVIQSFVRAITLMDRWIGEFPQ